MAANGHRGQDRESLESFGGNPWVGVLPAVPGVDVLAGNHRVVAYPAAAFASSEHWPELSSSVAGPHWEERRQWRWPSLPISVTKLRWELCPVLDLTSLPRDDVDDLVLAAVEAASNAVEHAHAAALPFFDVCVEVGEKRARIVIQDHGRWRPPTAGGDRGRGLQMIGRLTDATLTVGPWGTTVVLCNPPGSPR